MTAALETRPLDAKDSKPPLDFSPGYSLYNREFAGQRWLIDRLVPRNSICCLNGFGGTFKSWILTHAGLAVANGLPFAGRFKIDVLGPRNSVLFVQLEESEQVAQKKYRWCCSGFGLGPEEIQDSLVGYVVGQPVRIDDEHTMGSLSRLVEQTKPDLVMWDNARKMKRGDENTSEFWDELVFKLKSLQAVWPSAHVMIHHWRKLSSDKTMNVPGQRARGSIAMRDAVDVNVEVERNPDGFVTLLQEKNRDGAELPAFNASVRIHDDIKACEVSWLGTSTGVLDPDACASQILEMLRDSKAPSWTKPEVEAAMHGRFAQHQVRYALAVLERAKAIVVYPSKGRKPTILTLRGDGPVQLDTDGR